MANDSHVMSVMELYPRIFFACHTRHVLDPKTRKSLTPHQLNVLDHLDDREPISLVRLARHSGVTPSTMSISVNRLAQMGYVRKERSEKDARVVLLWLSEAGVRMKQAHSVLDVELVQSMLGRLSTAEQEEAMRGLGLLARAADEMMQERSRSGRRRAEAET
jgi:MarR family transcriptional regulator, organic hydroperoxide resistance regulator